MTLFVPIQRNRAIKRKGHPKMAKGLPVQLLAHSRIKHSAVWATVGPGFALMLRAVCFLLAIKGFLALILSPPLLASLCAPLECCPIVRLLLSDIIRMRLRRRTGTDRSVARHLASSRDRLGKSRASQTRQ